MKWFNGALLILAMALLGCTKGGGNASSPEGALDQYVHIAFGVTDVKDSQKMLALSTGEAREWLASMSEDAFKAQFMKNHMQLVNFTTKDKVSESDGDVSLVYELSFKDGSAEGDPTHRAVYSLKKIAYLTRKDEGTWKIKATKNVKTFIERKDDLQVSPLPSDTAAKNPAAGS